jgi:NDP-sugar pyrophosphorylase family protein
VKIPRQCAILVGGLGTRLGPLTEEVPKPLLDCGGRPFLAWILRELTRFGIEEVLLLAGYKPERVESFRREAQTWLPKSLSIKVSVEPERAGTGGALWHARSLLDETFLLIIGDSWIDTNLASFFSSSAGVQDAIGCALLRRMADCSRYGTADLRGNHIAAFHEKTPVSAPGLINGGVYLFDKAVLEFLSSNCSLEVDVLPLLADEGLLAGFVTSGYFIDIGVPADYARAGIELPRRLMRPAVFFQREGVLNKDGGLTVGEHGCGWIDGARDVVCLANNAGLHVFVVVSPDSSAGASCTDTDVESLNCQMLQDLLHFGGTIDEIRRPSTLSIASNERSQAKRGANEPVGGLIQDLLASWQVIGSRSFFVAHDSAVLQAARNGGIEGHLFSGGNLLEFVTPLIDPIAKPTDVQ